jgi:hypothetical protein
MIASADTDLISELLESLPADGPEEFPMLAIAVAACFDANVALPPRAPAIAQDVLRVFEGDSTAVGRFPSPLLAEVDGFVPPSLVCTLADALYERRVLPAVWRLPYGLALADVERLVRLVQQTTTTAGRWSDAWTLCTTECYLALLDASIAIPAEVQHEVDLLLERPSKSDDAGSYDAQLRAMARQEPGAALELLEEAAANVGHAAVAEGQRAVLGRLAKQDRSAVEHYLREHTYTLDERIAAFSGSIWESPAPADSDLLRAYSTELERDLVVRGLAPREAWAATFDLLCAAARLGEATEAAAIVQFAGPPEWTVLNATAAPCRKRASTAGIEGNFLAQIEPALALTGQGRAAIDPPGAPNWARLPPHLRRGYWQLRALPWPSAPWWRTTDGGLP